VSKIIKNLINQFYIERGQKDLIKSQAGSGSRAATLETLTGISDFDGPLCNSLFHTSDCFIMK
jgi:hypothetical protein